MVNNKEFSYLRWNENLLTLFKMGLFGAAHRWGAEQKASPSLKSVAHILH